MNIAELAIKKKVFTLFVTILCIGAGIIAFENLGRLEDPEFTIKDALITTVYPGANALQVEEEVTERIESAVQQLAQLKRVTSISKPGVSIVTATIKDKYDKSTLPQVWDELRRKINDMQESLPPGVKPSVVNDDYGDVFGILFAIHGKGFTYKELEEYADFLRKQLLLVPDVGKVSIYGVQPQQVHVIISRDRVAQLGISLDRIYAALAKQNLIVPAGSVKVGDEYIRIEPTGGFGMVSDIGDLLISGDKPGETIYLKDIAEIKRSYQTPPQFLIRYNGEASLAIGVSIASGGNVVKLGENIKKKLDEIKSQIPVGIELGIISFQPDSVTESIDSFIISLIEALAIVIVVLMIFMGLRSGLMIGFVLLLTVLTTFIFMNIWGVNLERISLGALIIALGMLVDNAIVVTEGMLVKIESGVDRLKAAREIVSQSAWPLLGATIIAILAFAAIGLSQDSTGEYTRSLFQVILISLLLSWIIAITVTPLLCEMFFKAKKLDGNRESSEDPYRGAIFMMYRTFLVMCLRFRYFAVVLMVSLLAAAIVGFGYLESSFFPQSTRSQFLVHFWLPEGTDISVTENQTKEFEKHIRNTDGVTDVATFIGGGAPRFILTYTPEKQYSSYAILIVSVDDYTKIDGMFDDIQTFADNNFLDAQVKIRKFVLGPGKEDTIEARFSGSDRTVLRELSDQAKQVFETDGGLVGIKDNWRQRVKVITPLYEESQARQSGITRTDLANMLQTSFGGRQVGIYREEDKLLPIVSVAPDAELSDVDNIKHVQVWSPIAQIAVPIRQVVSEFSTSWADGAIQRRNRIRTITAAATQRTGNASVVFQRIKPQVEGITLPVGYKLEWGGEYEDAGNAQTALFKNIPSTIILIVLVLVGLFNAIRQPLIIMLTVPLAIIGVTVGLLLTGQSFGFMALLGFLSLSGMLIKNAIVLIDQIDLEIRDGKDPYQAILDSSVSRMRPVMMAAVTTVLGMIPLVTDVFFVGMAVTIMAGLSFATILTLVFVPVLYAIFFRIPNQSSVPREQT